MKIFTKEFNNKLERFFTNVGKNFELNFFEGAGSIIGFVISQFVWIWVLNGFLGWFIMWFIEVTQYSNLNYTFLQLKDFFWLMYGCWFAVNILTRLMVIKTYKEEKKK